MEKDKLGKKIYEISHITGNFVLRSGKTSTEYFDKYLFESNPGLLDEITRQMVQLIPGETEILGGLEMGGIPLTSALSLKTKLPSIFVRKEAKSYGTKKLAEGLNFRDTKVCLVEDVVTTGGQIIKSANQLRELGAKIDSVICVIVREDEAFKKLLAEGLELFPLFSMDELKAYSKEE